MEGDEALHSLREVERHAAGGQQLGEELRVVHDRVARPELPVVLAQAVQAVRAGHEDLPEPVLLEASRCSPARAGRTGTRCPSGAPGRPCTSPRAPAWRSPPSPPSGCARGPGWSCGPAGRWSPAQPTQSRYSTSRPPSSAITGTSSPSAHSRRRSRPTPHGLPCTSMPLKAVVASCGKSDSIITRLCRRPMRSPGTESMRTGHAWTQAAQVVHAHSSSTCTCPSTGR